MSAQQIEKVRQPTESQSVATEAEGNWGTSVNGFQVGISLPSSWFKIGDKIPVQMFVRNISDQELRYAFQVPDKKLRIELRRNEERIPLKSAVSDQSFRERVSNVVQLSRLLHIQPGTQRQHMFELAEMYNLSEPGQYTMRAGRLVPGIGVETDRECFSEWVAFELRAYEQE
jgi:hypothetical protein